MLIVNISGILLILFIIWWFWLYKPKEVNVTKQATVIVEDGIYQPSRIKVIAGKPVSIQFLRKDASPCAETVVFPDFNVSEVLPLGKNKSINLPAMEKGEYTFHCQMQMYQGVLIAD